MTLAPDRADETQVGYRVCLWLMIAWGQIENLEEVDPEWQSLLPKYPSEAIRPVSPFIISIFMH